MNARVFWGASGVVAAMLVTTLLMPGTADHAFEAAQNWTIVMFGWFYIASVAIFLVVVLAMLFAAGMGIGLMYVAVAEPIQHHVAPPDVQPDTITVRIALIALVMVAATLSVLSGADRGIRRLPEMNLILAILLMFVVLAVGPPLFRLRALVQNFGLYLDHFVKRTFTRDAYEPGAWTLLLGVMAQRARRSGRWVRKLAISRRRSCSSANSPSTPSRQRSARLSGASCSALRSAARASTSSS